jgi:hypothetical protein
MVAGRFQRWAAYRALCAKIVSHLQAGGAVQITTYTKSWVYSAKHATWFTATKDGVFVQQGKGRVCIHLASIRFGRKAA